MASTIKLFTFNDGLFEGESVRVTDDKPPRVCVQDVLEVILGSVDIAKKRWQRLRETYPELVTKTSLKKFPGRGRHPSPVADAKTLVEIIMLLGGPKAKRFREEGAALIVRYLGGDVRLLDEITDINEAAQSLPSNHPMGFFRDSVQTDETLLNKKRAREDQKIKLLDVAIKEAELKKIKMAVETMDFIFADDPVRRANFRMSMADNVQSLSNGSDRSALPSSPLPPRRWTITEICLDLGYKPTTDESRAIGMNVAAAFKRKYGRALNDDEKTKSVVNGVAGIMVATYGGDDLNWVRPMVESFCKDLDMRR